MFDVNWLHQQEFYKTNKILLDEKRGAGFWAWKPYIIKWSMQNFSEKICYIDASTIFEEDPTTVIENVSRIATVDSEFINCNWVKRDCFVYMNCDSEYFWYDRHIWAGCVIVHPECEWAIEEWLSYCVDRRTVSDDPNVCGYPDLPEFRDHRHDQAILSLLASKWTRSINRIKAEDHPFRDV
jgi:hypothetical protein